MKRGSKDITATIWEGVVCKGYRLFLSLEFGKERDPVAPRVLTTYCYHVPP